MANLDKPQIQPTVGTAPPVSDWKSIGLDFGTTYSLLRGIVLYLQGYLTRVYNAVAPFQFNVQTVPQAISPYTVNATDEFIAAFAAVGADCVILLPPSPGPNPQGNARNLIISKMDNFAHNIVLTPVAGDTIDSVAAPVLITIPQDTVRLTAVAPHAWKTW